MKVWIAMGFLSSSTAIMVKKQLFTCLTSRVMMFSAKTLTPTSMEVFPVKFTEDKKVINSPT